MHGWRRGLKHVPYAILLAGQQCERVHLFVKKPSTPSRTLVRANRFCIACNETTFNRSVVIRAIDMVPGKDRSSTASSLLTSTL